MYKLRAWHRKSERLCEVWRIDWKFGIVAVQIIGANGKKYDYAWDISDVCLMRCTGVRDSCKNLIYEGDCLTIGGNFAVVGELPHLIKVNDKINFSYDKIDFAVTEIVGNVYEKSDFAETMFIRAAKNKILKKRRRVILENMYKLRAWHKKREQLCDVYAIDWNHKVVDVRIVEADGLEYDCSLGMNEVHLMRCTDVRDVNKKLIYEGDCLVINGDFAVVGESPYLVTANNKASFTYDKINSAVTEIVGNVHLINGVCYGSENKSL